MRVLVIDDSAAARAIFADVARRAGVDATLEAVDAESGIAMALRERPDVIVVDGRLPQAGPVATVAGLRSACPATPLFVVAALGETALVRAAVADGATGAILRPVVASRLARSLAEALGAPPTV